MSILSPTRTAAALGGLAIAVSAGAGVAAAAPDLGPIINTSCNYGQVTAALNAQDPGAAAELNASPATQTWLQSFLSAPPDQRQRMAAQAQKMPGADEYFGTVTQVANTCNNF